MHLPMSIRYHHLYSIFLLSFLTFGAYAHPFLPARGRGGATATATSTGTTPTSNRHPIRVAYQGEPGAYSEKSTRELLGPRVVAIGHPNFEACFRAVASMECDYACLPIENSLGGSIHENYDLMLRYDLTIVGEHEFRVHHCLLAKPGVKRDDIKYAISHPQALRQCDNFLRSMGITPIPTYDTAGSAKMISEGDTTELPEGCTTENTAAIASDLAGKTYGLNSLDTNIEDDDTNFTRFLLLARRGIAHFLTRKIPSKTSVVFTLPNTAGALYKALACFSLRDIDFSKIESRPTSASLLSYLKFQRSRQQHGRKRRSAGGGKRDSSPRFRYCFYLDFLASEHDENTQNALNHLREQSDFVRLLGSYPQKSRLVGPVHEAVEELKHMVHEEAVSLVSSDNGDNKEDEKPLHIGVVGTGPLANHLARHFSRKSKHIVSCLDTTSSNGNSGEQNNNKNRGEDDSVVTYYAKFQMTDFLRDLDVVVLAVPLVDLEEVVLSLPPASLRSKLIVEACPLNVHPKKVLLNHCGTDVDILSTNPMLGIGAAGHHHGSTATTGAYIEQQQKMLSDELTSWEGRPFVYEKVRVGNMKRADRFLHIFENARCQMVEMTADQHDESMADAEFVTHLVGQLVDLPPTPVSTKEYTSLVEVAESTLDEDVLFGMFKFHPRAKEHLMKLRENLARMERRLAAKEAYHTAAMEMKHQDRQRLIAETKLLLQEIVEANNKNDNNDNRGGITAAPRMVDEPSEEEEKMK